MIYKSFKENVKKNKKIRLDGGYTCIPFILLPKLGKVIPGIEQEKYYLVTANSKVGKTKLADFMFVYNPYEFITKYQSDISVKIMYFSLEVSKEDKIAQFYSYKLYKDHNLIISPGKIKSRFEDYILEDHVEKFIDSYDEEMERFESMIEIIDNVSNPYGIYKHVRDYAYKNGAHLDEKGNVIPVSDLMSNNIEIRDAANKKIFTYKPNNPNEYVIVMVDHYSLLHPEKGGTLWDAIFSFSSKYALNMKNRWKYIPVGVQQQASDQEKQQFTFKGDSIVAKLRPTPDGLGDCKLTQRDVNTMFGLFDPHRYRIEDYEGYNIERLEDNYREFSVLLNRDGSGFINIDLYFNGAINYFKELPLSKDIKEEHYKAIENLRASAK